MTSQEIFQKLLSRKFGIGVAALVLAFTADPPQPVQLALIGVAGVAVVMEGLIDLAKMWWASPDPGNEETN